VTHSPIIRFERRRPSPSLIKALARYLADGHLAVVPTETQYALTADATSEAAIRRVRVVKGREARQPFSVFFANPGVMASWRIIVPAWAGPLADVLWPGPVTLILPTKNLAFRRLGSTDSVGVRISPEPMIRALTETLARPLLATSANPSGAVLPVREENEWLAQGAQNGDFLWMRPQRFLRRPPSTVLDCCGTRPKLIRAGAVPAEIWRQVLRENR